METTRIGPSPFIAVDHAGKGDLVLFLHGIGGNRTNWHDQIEALSSRYHAAALDARGWGLSDDYDGPLGIDDMADDAVRVMDHLGASSAHVVGLSMGGLVAQHIWYRHPGRVRSLVLCDTSPGLARSQTLEEREEFLRLREEPLLAGKTPADIAPGVARTLIGSKAPPAALQRLTDSLAVLHKESYLKALRAVTFHEVAGDIGTITVPCLLLVGTEDRLTPPRVHEEMRDRIAGARLVVIPDAGHLSNIEAPGPFNAALLDFLSHAG
ncbi:alpha/beta fold hydrolase [Roseomonas sp. CCTCC AB2023176]|uniref:alpha/beta fold hydrolase n=1 Tax=Roseomonas sp. CCTCC AB2023176 TaxID=3342640 RepID=UPI0035D7C279